MVGGRVEGRTAGGGGGGGGGWLIKGVGADLRSDTRDVNKSTFLDSGEQNGHSAESRGIKT